MHFVRTNSLALPHCDENDSKQYLVHSYHVQSLSFSTLRRPESEKRQEKSTKRETLGGTLAPILGNEGWENKTKKIALRHSNE